MSNPSACSAAPPMPQSAYVHVPFCRHRCGYCNFTLLAGRDDLMDAYLEALELEMSRQLGTAQQVATIFLGGGTPTHLPPRFLEQLLQIVHRWLSTSPGGATEFSCEANPMDCDDQRLQILRDHGVNRLSLGGQSFSSRKLQVLERDHSPDALRRSLERCSRYFENVSLDLIFATPHETLDEWQQDLTSATTTSIVHLSTYGLTIERGAAFYGRSLKQEIVEVESDLQLAMYELAIEYCAAADLQHYEVSNFAKPSRECRHNQAYWLGAPWWAFGPGAASFTWDAAEHCMVRSVNHASTTTYLRRVLSGQSPIRDREPLTLEQRTRERLVFGLRMMNGVAFSELDRLLGTPARTIFEPALTEFLQRGWLQFSSDNNSSSDNGSYGDNGSYDNGSYDTGRLQLTRSGLVISDSLWPRLL